jgi:ribosomal protein S18 acetylase RimI-like enzyme
VTGGARRRGIGRELVRHALALVEPPAEVMVHTFTDDTPVGLPARRFYESLGFDPAQMATDPHGSSRQVFRLKIDA